ncbi:hypothetical protein SAMN05446935_9846 [Burkholderia sp. YR290]|nr:hypothetical protein SAMN05446935_9846 [Burkholderia sp. YR290]
MKSGLDKRLRLPPLRNLGRSVVSKNLSMNICMAHDARFRSFGTCEMKPSQPEKNRRASYERGRNVMPQFGHDHEGAIDICPVQMIGKNLVVDAQTNLRDRYIR